MGTMLASVTAPPFGKTTNLKIDSTAASAIMIALSVSLFVFCFIFFLQNQYQNIMQLL
jgi:low affinity Fe/Cu permease